MPDSNLFRSPDENSGPAVLDREPIVLPQQRKKAIRRIKDLVR